MILKDANVLRETMYHTAFETDSDMQKWDSGCWIRYKMFENALDNTPTIDAVEVVRCKDCKHLSNVRVVPKGERICLRYCCGKSDEGFCDEGKRREDDVSR